MRLALLLVAVAFGGCGGGASDAPSPGSAVPGDGADSAASADIGGLAPDFTLTGLDGEPFTLSAHRGEVIVINFWATWCTPCLAEMPELEALHQELGAQGVQIVGISQDTGDPDAVRQMAERLGVTYPILPDPAFQIATRYGGIPALPTTVFVGPDGRVTRRELGALSASKLRAAVAQARGRPVS